MLNKIQTFILDTLFPITCINCGRDGFWLCKTCLKNIELLSIQTCPECEDVITDSGRTCRNCNSSSLDGLLAVSKYQENNISKLVHLYKYRFIEDLHIPLGKIATKQLLQSTLPIPDIIMPVPLHPRRLRWRGFNQSQLIADYISQHLTPGLKITVEKEILLRKKHTPPQMKIKKYQERLSNLGCAFAIAQPEAVKNKSVLLVDDIATTGATIFECAKTLKLAGAKKIFAIVIARQDMK